MELRTAFVIGLSVAIVLSMAVSADADFNYVRSIPAPHNPEQPDHITGLDRAGSLLLVVATWLDPDSLNGGSRLFEIAPTTGEVMRQQDFVGAPLLCATNFWQVSACAYWFNQPDSSGVYWAADECGDIDEFTWPDSIRASDSFMLPAVPHPISMVASGDTLFALNMGDFHEVIARVHVGETVDVDTIPLEGLSGVPVAMTIWHDHFLVSTSVALLWEYTKDGYLVAIHTLNGGCLALNMAGFDDLLYVAGADSNSICIFEPAIYQSEVPEGDSVVVEAIPERVEVLFDSVSTAGSFTGQSIGGDPCPPPDGVIFFGEFYHLTTDAYFDYAAQVAVSRPEGLPPGADADRVRVFARPSGDCQAFQDITVAPTEFPTLLMSLTRTKSEDDEFSVFVLGEDARPPRAPVELKLDRLGGAIDAGAGSIPPLIRTRLQLLLGASRDEYHKGRSGLAATYADSIATIVRSVPAIPHTFDPGVPGQNIAGGLVSDAHTLSFSLRFSESHAIMTPGFLVPDYIDECYDGFIRAYFDVPLGFEPAEVDNQHIFIEHQAQAIPESTSVVGSYLKGNAQLAQQVRAVFHSADVEAVLPPVNETTVRLTCFINGYEVFTDPIIHGAGAAVRDVAETIVPRLDVKPNPSTFSFAVDLVSANTGPVKVSVYSVQGTLVRTLFAGKAPQGLLTLVWDGDSDSGKPVAPGAYFIVARTDGGVLARKVILRR